MHIRETRQRTSVCKRRRNFVKAASCAAAARAAALVKNAKRARRRAAERIHVHAAPTGSARGENSAARTRSPRSGYNKTADPAAPRRCPAASVCREPSLRRQFAKHTKQSKPRPRTGRRGTRSFSGGEPLRRRIRRCAGGKQDRRRNAPAGCG